MKAKNIHIWIWLQGLHILKAILNLDNGILSIYNEYDDLILKRTGLNKNQIDEVEKCIIRYGAKKLDGTTKPFKFL